MNTKTRRKLKILLIGIVACIAFWPGLVYREFSSYRCQVCFATRDRLQWWVGRWEFFAVPVTPPADHITASKFGADFVPNHEVHRWKVAGDAPYYWGVMWGGCAIGAGRHVSPVLSAYESVPKFRKYVQDQVANGAIERRTAIGILSNTSRDGEFAKAGQDLLDTFWRTQ